MTLCIWYTISSSEGKYKSYMNLPMVTFFMVKNFLVLIFLFVSSDSLHTSQDKEPPSNKPWNRTWCKFYIRMKFNSRSFRSDVTFVATNVIQRTTITHSQNICSFRKKKFLQKEGTLSLSLYHQACYVVAYFQGKK